MICFRSTGAALVDSELFLRWGTADTEFTDLRLVDQDIRGGGEGDESILVRVFAELHPTDETVVGGLRIITSSDGREFVVATSLQFVRNTANNAINPYVRGEIGSDIPPALGYDGGPAVLDRVTCDSNGGVRTITRYYLKASDTPQQLGDTSSSMASGRAFVGTSAGAITASTRFAREWTVRYLVKGDGSVGDTHWHAVSSVMLFGSRTGFLTGTRTVRQGLGYSIVARVFNELPDTLKYGQRGQYTFPAKLGYSSRLGPYVSAPSTTREITFEIEETYQVGEPLPLTMEYEPLKWAEGVLDYTRATGEDGAKAYNFPGAIGLVSVSITNKVFAGYLCSTVAGTVQSDPNTYPSGKKRISSKPSPWRGNIWVTRNVYVTFP